MVGCPRVGVAVSTLTTTSRSHCEFNDNGATQSSPRPCRCCGLTGSRPMHHQIAEEGLVSLNPIPIINRIGKGVDTM